jgi:hypothetical protein
MIKRAAAPILAFFLATAALTADWKSDLRAFLDPPRRDFAAARALLRESHDGLEPADKQSAEGLLAFLAQRTGDAQDELERIVAYFETYGDADPAFDFLDEALGREFMLFWGTWKTSYPLASGFVFLERTGDDDPSPPARLEVGLELLNDAYYRVSVDGVSLSGGLWQGGFHILRLPFTGGYDRTGEIAFDLDLKTTGLVVRKRITVKVDVETSSLAFELPAVAPAAGRPAPRPPRAVEGEVSLYVGDKLILTSRKLSSKPAPLKIPIPGPSPWGTKPFIVPRKDGPQFNQFSIIDAISEVYKAIKDIGKKRKAASVSPPTYKKTQALGFAFTRPGPSGPGVRYRATVSLAASNGTVARERGARTL